MKPRLFIWLCAYLGVCLVIMSPCLYCAGYLLRLDPFIAPLLGNRIMGFCSVACPLTTILIMIPYLWVCFRRLVVTLDKEQGIEIGTGRRHRQVPLTEVASFKYRPSKYRPTPLYLLRAGDGKLWTTPVLVIPPVVDCEMIARLLEEMGVPREEKPQLIRIWKYREVWDRCKGESKKHHT